MGLFEGTSHLQYLYETNTGAGYNDFHVDVLNAGEVINVHTCGVNTTDNIRVVIEDELGTSVYDSTAAGTICGSDLNTTFDPAVTTPHQFVATSAQTYIVRMFNENGDFLSRYDVTVTNSTSDIVDPRDNGGRVWSLFWRFNATTYAIENATSANLYVVADGGFVGTYFVWRLDLNNFAGYVYSLTANDLGVNSPNAAGDVVAGISVPTGNNSVQPKYPIYLSYPEKTYPRPVGGVNVSGLGFIDSDGEDSGISPGTTSTIQDSGTFTFTTDLTTSGVYEIVIDNSSPSGGGPDGDYGQGDIYLRGNAVPGLNTVVWSGDDNNGNIVPNGAYTARLSVRTGEFHFTAQDVETSGGPGSTGIKIYRAEGNGLDLPATIYWDDATVLNSTATDAFNQDGIFDGDHNWGTFSSGGIGNNTYIDTYAFGRVEEPNPVGLAITENDIPLPTVSKSFFPSTIYTGGTSTMQIEIQYNGILALSGIALQDVMPEGMALVSGPSSFTVTGAGCSGFSFSPATVAGGSLLELDGGNIAPDSTCTISADVTAILPGNLVNTTSGLSSNELATGVLSNGASLYVEPPVGGVAFSCDAAIYEAETSGSTTRLYTLDSSGSTYSRSEYTGTSYSPTLDYSYTGLAQNPLDGYLYAIVDSSTSAPGVPRVGSILRIEQDGGIVNLGVPVRGPNTMEMPLYSDRFVGGTIGENGRYVVVTDLSATSGTGAAIPLIERGLIIDIDLSSSPPQVQYNRRHGRDIGDVVAHVDGNYYSYNPIEGLITLDPSSGAVGIVGGTLSENVSGLATDAWGAVYAHTEAGNLYNVDVTNGNATLMSTLAGSSTTDSASCPFGVAMTKTVAAADIAPGSNTTYTVTVTNQSDNSIVFSLSDDLADSRSFIGGTLSNPFGGTVADYEGASLLSLSSASIAANSTEVLQVSVYYPADYPMGDAPNQAILTSPSLSGNVVSDDPTTIATPDATLINVLPNPSIGVAKKAIVNGLDVAYEVRLENLGNTVGNNVVLADDLDAVFGAGNYAFTTLPQLVDNPGTLTLNAAYDGSAVIDIIEPASTSSLAIGASATIRFAVRVLSVVDTGSGIGVYSNQVEVFFEDPDSNVVSDLSVDGDNADPDDDGFPAEQSPTVINVTQIIQVQGTVFVDNGAGSGIAHNGILENAEASLGGLRVEVLDGSGVIASTVTSADGSYLLVLPGSVGNQAVTVTVPAVSSHIAISEFYAQDPGATGSVTDGQVEFTPQLSFSGAYTIDFGMVATPVWEAESIAENEAGSTVYHVHKYRAQSSGVLSITQVSPVATPVNDAWRSVLFHDQNCDGVLSGDEPVLPTVVAVDADVTSEVCVISKVFVPGDVSRGDNYTVPLEATLTYADNTGTGHALTDTRSITDLTTVITAGGGRLSLSKTVQNVTAGGAETTGNSASSGDVLRYRINFSNTGSGPVTEVLISDSTPAFTGLANPVVCPATMPLSLSCIVLVPAASDNSPGYSGMVQWQFTGSLVAGDGGDVVYEISVE